MSIVQLSDVKNDTDANPTRLRRQRRRLGERIFLSAANFVF